MNFNKDLINHINGKTIDKIVTGAKELSGKINDELASGSSKDLSKSISAEDAIGRASFSLLKQPSQVELSKRLEVLKEKLGLSTSISSYDSEKLKNACMFNDKLHEPFISVAEEFYKLGDLKPKEQKFCWEGYIGNLTELVKQKDGCVNEEIYSCIKTLLKEDKISVRGIEDIIKGCEELLYNSKTGYFDGKFNKKAFNEYKEFINLNGKSMHENDDVFTLYLGRTLNGVKRSDSWNIKGQDYIFDDVAFNFAKRMYEQGEDILHMQYFLKHFHKYSKDSNYVSGFRFEPERYDGWAKTLTEKIKTDLNEDIIESCKVDGKDSLHNLLVADTVKRKTDLYGFEIPNFIENLKDNDGFARTDILSYLLKKEGKLYTHEIDYVKQCLNSNGSVNGEVLQKVFNKEIYSGYIENCRVNGEIKMENVDVLSELLKKEGDQRYLDYQIKEIFELLKNKDGIVDKELIPYLDDMKQLTHLAPIEIKACLTNAGKIDKSLFDLRKELIKKYGYYDAGALLDICKNADGSANTRGLDLTRKMVNSGMKPNQNVVNAFKDSEGNVNWSELESFIEDFANTESSVRTNALYMSTLHKEKTVDLVKYKALKEAMLNPEIEPLVKDYTNAEIIEAKIKPITVPSEDVINHQLYRFSHLKQDDINILERNGYSAKFYNELGKEQKFSVDAKPEFIKTFEKTFIKGAEFDSKILKANFGSDIKLEYDKNALSADIIEELNGVPDEYKATIKRAFKLNFGQNGIEGFPQRFDLNAVPPKGMEKSFKAINEKINKFYSSEIKTDDIFVKEVYSEVSEAIPEFKMLIGNIDKNGERVDVQVLKNIAKLIKAPEYHKLSEEEKTISKMSVLLNSLEHIDSKPSVIQKEYWTDNDGIRVTILADWKKKAEYANSVLERFNLSENLKYRITQIINDVGWAKKLEKGELTPYDIAINHRYKGDEKIAPLVERILTGECKYDKKAVQEEMINIHKNQQIFNPTKIDEFAPFIETKIVDGKELKYVDLDRPELKDKCLAAHFLGYDGYDHTLNIMKNRAYRSAFSLSLVKGGEHSSCFAGRNTGIVADFDNVNIANMSHTNIESGFGKTYKHLKESLMTDADKDIKHVMKKELDLNDDEYGKLMTEIVPAQKDSEINDCVINGKKVLKEDIIKAKEKGTKEILKSSVQNETTVLNPIPIGTIGIGESLEDYAVKDAIYMAQNNDLIFFFKRSYRD